METRNIVLTLKEAKEFYNSNNNTLKEIALRAYTIEELVTPDYVYIKTFEDACNSLSLNIEATKADIYNIVMILEDEFSLSVEAIYKLNIIRKALNEDWNPNFIDGTIYYPIIRIYPDRNEVIKDVTKNNWQIGPSFISNSVKYILVNADDDSCLDGGLADCGYSCGNTEPNLGLLGCKSKEIAKHFGKYFMKEIFDAIYAPYIGLYRWV